MKILVFSDSHQKSASMLKAAKLHPDAEYILHLGDGISDLEYIKNCTPDAETISVNGNFEDSFFCFKKGKNTECITVGGKKIFMCHGHRLGVNFSLQSLIYSALECSADIALFGHTHVKFNRYIPAEKLNIDRENGLYLFNPGSISRPRDGIYHSFGLIEIKENGILMSHGIIK